MCDLDSKRMSLEKFSQFKKYQYIICIEKKAHNSLHFPIKAVESGALIYAE